MSCTVPVFALIQDVNRVISILNDAPVSGEQNVKDNVEGWDDDSEEWGWTEAVESEPEVASTSWLQECSISLSPSNDTLAIAKNDKAVFLTSRWIKPSDSQPSTKYEIVWSGSLATEEGECVTDILCIPLASQHKSSQGSPDWTCIVAGFTSGYMRIYLQNGFLLLSQFLHDDSVLRLKCRTWQPHKNYGTAEQVEELAILYPTAMVIIDGFSLYQSLRACRNQLARAQASGLSGLIGPPPLAYKKWRFDGQGHITDIASCGVVPPNMFDQLQTASFIGGFQASIRSSMPAISHYISTGKEPFVAVYTSLGGSSPSLLSDVALEVASKLTTAVLSKLSAASGWLGWGSNPASQSTETSKRAKPQVEKGTSLPVRFGLPDTRRRGTSITLAPNGRLAVTTDDFGRVMLLDVKKTIVVRIWKGYRDAECGWIWRTEQGPRVAAFNIGKDCRLLYAGHGIMGLGHVIRQGQAPPQHTLNCTLIQGDGTLKTFSVPFHCALSDKHSKRVRDLHLLKKLSVLLDSTKSDQESKAENMNKLEKDLLNILSDIQTPQLHQQAKHFTLAAFFHPGVKMGGSKLSGKPSEIMEGLQCVLSTVGIPSSVLLKAVTTVKDTAQKQSHTSYDHEDEREDTKSLVDFCDVQRQLIETHDSIQKLDKEKPGSEGKPWKGKSKEMSIANLLGVTKSEASELLSALNPTDTTAHKGTNHSFPQLAVSSFLGCFEYTSAHQQGLETKAKTPENTAGPSRVVLPNTVGVRKGLSNDITIQLASFLFKNCLLGDCSSSRLAIPLESSGIKPQHLMGLLPYFGGQGGLPSENSSSQSHDNDISPWWENVRHTLAQSTSTNRALSLAAVCRSVALEISTASKKVEDEGDAAEREELAAGDWISVSVEIERWNLLVFQLTDLQALSGFINRLAANSQRTKQAVDNSGSAELSVVGFLSSGPGAASKVISKYIVQCHIPASHLGTPHLPRKTETQNLSEAEDEDKPEIDSEPVIQVELEGLSELRLRFPHSLEQDILWAHCVMECVTYWQSNKEETSKLFLALEHLRCIHVPALQHGLAVTVWKRFFKETISATVMLMEKVFDRTALYFQVGKAPKDRLCRKTVELSFGALKQFLKATVLLLDVIAEVEWTESRRLALETEDFWHTGETGTESLIEGAQEKPESNGPLVKLHAKLVTVLWIVMGLDMKSVKPMTLFDTKSKDSFMRDLSSSRPLSSNEVDKAIVETREKFFTRALSFTVSAMSAQSPNPILRREDSDTDNKGAILDTTSCDWPAVIYKLAEQFGMESDPFKRHYVRELYSAGFDEIAKQTMFSVHDQRALASHLLRIVGQRLAYIILDASESTERANRLSRLPTQISSWIRSQDPSRLSRRMVPLSHTVDLLRMVLSLTPEESPDYSLTSGLTETIKFLL
ncbi:Rab3 GTPase-activating protein non-catalytic subunit [Stylophora pistillata]|uniref:Rab3 GTPase-activating protein non-catalytic subunit n=1 Tax=Stylophora pistillata TaxID=50429 RepID=A0A2B4SCU3_STYPI|nr:Rab3 GTPase-activating protein non-catalytic subunit [Stylophora pistillata]